MPSKSKQSTTKPVDIKGKTVRNKILLALPQGECDLVFEKLEFVTLPASSVLSEAGEIIKNAYFINDGLASVLSEEMDGASVEVGLAGSEGFAGLPLIAGLRTSSSRIVMQVAGSAFMMPANQLAPALNKCPQLMASLQRLSQEMALQSGQVAACNRLHEIDERLARWLLMSQDRLGGDDIPLTQEYLAHMLGTRRASVTVAAGMLQKAGIVGHRRGSVKILSRSRLEDASCDCYKIMTEQIRKWRSEVC